MLFQRRRTEARTGPAAEALGVGVLYEPALAGWIQEHLDLVDYIEVVPDLFWVDRGPGCRPRFVERPSTMAALEWLNVRRPLVLHCHGLSLGSAEVDDPEYRDQVVSWVGRYRAAWLSDHLSFDRVGGDGARGQRAALPLPIAYDDESLAVVAERVRAVQQRLAVPVLIENTAAIFELAEAEMTQARFLNALVARTGCSLLLDLPAACGDDERAGPHAAAFLEELELGAVAELHVATVSTPARWQLLERVTARAAGLRGLTFERHGSPAPAATAGLRSELERAQALWGRARRA